MEVNTVLLSVEDYNELRDFKQNIESNYTVKVSLGRYGKEISYMETNDALIEIASMNKKINDDIFKLTQFPIGHVEVGQVKKMSIWEFVKWRRK